MTTHRGTFSPCSRISSCVLLLARSLKERRFPCYVSLVLVPIHYIRSLYGGSISEMFFCKFRPVAWHGCHGFYKGGMWVLHDRFEPLIDCPLSALQPLRSLPATRQAEWVIWGQSSNTQEELIDDRARRSRDPYSIFQYGSQNTMVEVFHLQCHLLFWYWILTQFWSS